MISCTEFIWVYNELFRFLEARGGEAKVIEFWKGISDEFLGNLRDYVAKDGLEGMYRYWSHTLGEDFRETARAASGFQDTQAPQRADALKEPVELCDLRVRVGLRGPGGIDLCVKECCFLFVHKALFLYFMIPSSGATVRLMQRTRH